MEKEKVDAAFTLLGENDWDTQEKVYSILLKVVGNLAQNPQEQKFRSLKTTNKAIKEKILDVPGGKDFLLAVGFEEEGENLTMRAGGEAQADAAQEALQAHATAMKERELRRERDAKIAQRKEEDAKVNRMKGEGNFKGDDMETIKKQMEIDRLEREKDNEMRPVQASKDATSGQKFGATVGDTSFMRKGGG